MKYIHENYHQYIGLTIKSGSCTVVCFIFVCSSESLSEMLSLLSLEPLELVLLVSLDVRRLADFCPLSGGKVLFGFSDVL